MSYCKYFSINVFKLLCCCCIGWCKKNNWCKLHLKKVDIVNAARKKLREEFDFNHIIKVLRISSFMSKLKLTHRQRLTVDFFRRYTVRQ